MQIPEECAASLQLLRLDDAIEVSDWERFYCFSISQSFSGPMERKIICQAPAKYQLLERIRQAKKKKRVDALAKAVAEITQGAIKHKVRFAIIKGFSFSALLYDSPYDRTLSDIDTLVNDVDMPKMDALLRSLGFRQFAAVEGGVELELPFPILKANGHHEYFEYEKVIDDVEVVVEVSRWFHVNIQDRTDAFLSRSITRHFGGLDFPSLSEEDCAVNLLENAYHNSFGIRSNLFKGVARLKDIEDVVRLRKYAQKETLIALVAQYPFADKILSLAEELCSSELRIERAEDVRHSDIGKKTYALRSQTIELVFADAKEKHSISRAERGYRPGQAQICCDKFEKAGDPQVAAPAFFRLSIL